MTRRLQLHWWRFPRLGRRLWIILGLAAVLAAGCQGPRELSDFPGQALDLNDRPINVFEQPDARAIVLAFVGIDCPISNRYAPRLQRLHERFGPLGIRFHLIYPERDATPAKIRQHTNEYQYSIPAARDPRHALVKFAGARVTPEVAVFGPDRRLLYRGRIDDQYVELGRSRLEPSQHDLRDALDAIVAGQPVARAFTRAVGCYIPD